MKNSERAVTAAVNAKGNLAIGNPSDKNGNSLDIFSFAVEWPTQTREMTD